MPTLEELYEQFEDSTESKHRGRGTWVERTLTEEQQAFILKLRQERGVSNQWIANFLKAKLSLEEATEGKIATYFRKVGAA